MRDGQEFKQAVRRGRKAAEPAMVVHVVPGTDGVTSVGFVVSKAVGTAVVRNRVKRRLRHLTAARLGEVPAGSRIVVRARPSAATATSIELGDQLEAALHRAVAHGDRP